MTTFLSRAEPDAAPLLGLPEHHALAATIFLGVPERPGHQAAPQARSRRSPPSTASTARRSAPEVDGSLGVANARDSLSRTSTAGTPRCPSARQAGRRRARRPPPRARRTGPWPERPARAATVGEGDHPRRQLGHRNAARGGRRRLVPRWPGRWPRRDRRPRAWPAAGRRRSRPGPRAARRSTQRPGRCTRRSAEPGGGIRSRWAASSASGISSRRAERVVGPVSTIRSSANSGSMTSSGSSTGRCRIAAL